MRFAQHRVERAHQLVRVVEDVSPHHLWSYMLRVVHLLVASARIDVGCDRVRVVHGDLGVHR